MRKAIQAGHIHSMIFGGDQPGTGKTTLAEIIAQRINAEVERISAVTSGIKEIREAIDRCKTKSSCGS
ncbi:recombination factor protein RarA [Haemophilus influenzae]|uniref:Recombination factor protein RarA n=1 Tax=Haemophilus influenzae TaxID=727 RepID=A0A2X1PPC3_HAEIF|nr:recombination factor protein RarA [Haemophilus influenzae]